MKTSIRSLLAASTIAILLTACGIGTTSTPPSSEPSPTSPPPSVAPSEAPEAPEETPAANPTVVGTLTMIGAAVDGPGGPLADALAGDLSQPVFVRGALFLDTDGQLYFAESLVDAEAPTFGDLRVRVANYPTDGPTWDMASAELTGLQEANGIRFYADTKLYGTLTQ
jgi:hypothetical protein